MHRGEPYGQRQLAAMHHRAGRYGGLPTAIRTLQSQPLGRQFPTPHTAASRADEPVWPTPIRQIAGACRLVRKTPGKLRARHRTVMRSKKNSWRRPGHLLRPALRLQKLPQSRAKSNSAPPDLQKTVRVNGDGYGLSPLTDYQILRHRSQGDTPLPESIRLILIV